MTTTSAIQIFKYDAARQVRTMQDEQGSTWFVAKDVCDILELANPSKAVKSLDDDEKMTLTKSEGHSGQRGGAQKINFINESGLYALIFRSNKPEAKKFSRWVRQEVLPAIRKKGMYITERALVSEATIEKLLAELQHERTQNKSLLAQFEADRPKIALGELVYSMSGAVTMQDAANFLKQRGIDIGQNRLFALCREKKLLCSRKGRQWNKPTNKAMDRDFFKVKAGRECRVTVMMTPKLLAELANELLPVQLPLVFDLESSEEK